MKKILYFAGAVVLIFIGCVLVYVLNLSIILQEDEAFSQLIAAMQALWTTGVFLTSMLAPTAFFGAGYLVHKALDE